MKARTPRTSMPMSFTPFAFSNPFVLWGTFAMKTIEMQAAAAQVIALRTARMAAHGANPNAAERRELHRMGAEKVDAFSRAGAAIANGALPLVAGMAFQAFRSSMDLFNAATRLATSRTMPQTLHRQRALAETLIRHAPSARPGATAAARLAHRALAPVHSTATANAKRLGLKKLR